MRRLATGIGAALLLVPVAPGEERPAATPVAKDQVMVGAYYYPWWRGEDDRGRKNWLEKVPRLRLDPPQHPAAGLYSSDNPALISEHIAQSRRGGIDFWAVSWWGPDSQSDRVFRQRILKHGKASELRYAVLYESEGRFGGLKNPKFANWKTDLAYLREHIFPDPNYLKIGGRPVLIVYLTRALFRGDGEQCFKVLREEFPEVYLIGDEVFGPGYKPERAALFDAVTAYDVYGQSAKPKGSNRKAVEALARNYRDAREAAKSAGKGFVPVVAPGYNDTRVRPGNEPAPRYFAEEPGSQQGDVFRAMIADAALPNLDPATGNMMLVTSFNEWYEDTQIEATTGKAGATSKDNSDSGREVTRGMTYQDYGCFYLDTLREMTGQWRPPAGGSKGTKAD